jgi:hypothetical protein
MRLAHSVNPSQTVRVCYRGRMNIYIDIDGPLIRNGQPTAHCFEFLRWAVELHRPYWLTTRDAHGQHTGILRAFRHAMGAPSCRLKLKLCSGRSGRPNGRAARFPELISRLILSGLTTIR